MPIHIGDRWLAIIDSGAEATAALLTDETEDGRYMRAVAPLRALVTKEERDEQFPRATNKDNLER